MKFFFLTFILFSGGASAAAVLDDLVDKVPKDLFLSASAGVTSVNSNIDLQTSTGRKILHFNPNVPAGYKLGVETKYIELGYTFSGGSVDEKHKASDFQDFRINFFWRSFDVRLNYQHYEGAEVNESGKLAFYDDYEVKAYNARGHYYFQKDYLRVIREGVDLVRKAAVHDGFSGSGSFFVGVNLDRRRIQLPENLEPEHLARINKFGITYDTTFDAFTGGPLAGGDGMIQLGTFYLRCKLGVGPAFLPGGESIAQFELAFSTGFAFLQRHLISINADSYMIGFKDADQKISNLNTQVNILYTYAF